MALASAAVAASRSTRFSAAAAGSFVAPQRARGQLGANSSATRLSGLPRPCRPAQCSPGVRYFSDFISQDTQEGAGQLRLAFATACLPHPDKVKKGGEDAYFASPVRRAFGVADGVGGWAGNGVDPGEYARCLLRYAHDRIVSGASREEVADLQGALQFSARRLQDSGLQGGSTALLGQLNGATMAILNLGDSGAMVLRPALRTPPGSEQPLLFPRVVFRSSDQTHYFNCPYQMGSGGAQMEAPDFIHVRVRTGDVMIAATDGVFDNLFDHQVQAIVARQLGSAWRSSAPVKPQLQSLAASIAKQAQKIGKQEDQKDVITPFALAAHSEGLPFRGGKLDDVTVVVGLVCGPESGSDGQPEEEEEEGNLPLMNNFVRKN